MVLIDNILVLSSVIMDETISCAILEWPPFWYILCQLKTKVGILENYITKVFFFLFSVGRISVTNAGDILPLPTPSRDTN